MKNAPSKPFYVYVAGGEKLCPTPTEGKHWLSEQYKLTTQCKASLVQHYIDLGRSITVVYESLPYPKTLKGFFTSLGMHQRVCHRALRLSRAHTSGDLSLAIDRILKAAGGPENRGAMTRAVTQPHSDAENGGAMTRAVTQPHSDAWNGVSVRSVERELGAIAAERGESIPRRRTLEDLLGLNDETSDLNADVYDSVDLDPDELEDPEGLGDADPVTVEAGDGMTVHVGGELEPDTAPIATIGPVQGAEGDQLGFSAIYEAADRYRVQVDRAVDAMRAHPDRADATRDFIERQAAALAAFLDQN